MNKMNEELIAPCGINCSVCKYYLARERGLYKTKSAGCTGCIPGDSDCRIIKDCEEFGKNNYRFCYECGDFPCERIGRLEKRYAAKYNTGVIVNLTRIQKMGLSKWLTEEEEKWKCPECGGRVSMHTGTCFDCGSDSWGKQNA